MDPVYLFLNLSSYSVSPVSYIHRDAWDLGVNTADTSYPITSLYTHFCNTIFILVEKLVLR